MVQFKKQFYKELGSNIKSARENSGLTQEALAQRTGTNRTTVINIERGQLQLSVHLLLTFASVLEKTPMELVPTTTTLEDRPDEQRNWIEAGLRSIVLQG